ncbi:DUF2243 domain-containing protein [Domibacillus sp. DTU_2020_1001157_1_SI_ALB_TIR_016]|uniref:DUF2243 domain-containing protein n=1 Tax=Domibacillus sp. DTU_2020_1001157_1_SI_ALB_TIR_016 TaxID=3077789 RepID=UPI0028EAA5DF|nr:DUF2243 domain-containing protein [Domibacillus sp. DTU_2020_1001157_1_SI_ALB_TIR_016]WNS80656.1 DUF2243 domain-containing protein [Domibacillus sp. DTU_2020_1001157_1_SI_ALB_TIR_016]
MAVHSEEVRSSSHFSRRNLWSGFLFGIGFVAFFDEAVFHQLLHWHHFYDKSTTSAGLVSDGFFHAFSWFATVGGLFLFADLRRRNRLLLKKWIGGVLLGAGIFQLYDGTVQHKLMRLHQIRYVENVWMYDLVWNTTAVLMMVIGAALAIRTKKGERNAQ